MKRLVKIVVGGRDANMIQAGGLTMVGVQHKTVRPTGQFGLVYVSTIYDFGAACGACVYHFTIEVLIIMLVR